MPKPNPNVSYAIVNNQGRMQYRFGDRARAEKSCDRMNASRDPHMIPLKPYRIVEERQGDEYFSSGEHIFGAE